MVTVHYPATIGLDKFARYRECKVPHQRDEVTMALDDGLEDGEAVVGVVIGNAFDAADEGFRTGGHAGIIPHILDDPMRKFW